MRREGRERNNHHAAGWRRAKGKDMLNSGNPNVVWHSGDVTRADHELLVGQKGITPYELPLEPDLIRSTTYGSVDEASDRLPARVLDEN
jgi:hypothetical protein